LQIIVTTTKKEKHFVMVKISERSKIIRVRDLKEQKIVKDLQLELYGWSCGFYRSNKKKITVSSLLKGFWKMQDQQENTLEKWALHSGLELGTTLSKQAINSRLNATTVELTKVILFQALQLKLKEHVEREKSNHPRLFAKFNNILIQDSTMQKLPSSLSHLFPSSHSHGKQAATLRLQATYNFTTETWVDFELGGFTDNDQSKAMQITKVAEKGDLILRDLGYSTLESIEYLIKDQFVITPWDKKSNLYTCPQAEELAIDLVKLFKGKRKIDRLIYLGSKKRIPLRLVAKKLPKKIAKQRIESAKKDRHANTNHSATYFELLKWEIFLTNIDTQTINADDIAKLYALRWYIEILFKSWKSYANFKTILEKQRMSLHRTLISIYSMLIRFVYFMLDIYQYIKQKVKQKTEQEISILKFIHLCRNLSSQLLNIYCLEELDPWIEHFAKYATYEKRKDRLNMQQKYLYFKELYFRQQFN